MSDVNMSSPYVRQLAEDIKGCVTKIKEQTEALKTSIDKLGQTNYDESYNNLRNCIKLSENALGEHAKEFNSFVKTLNAVADAIDRYHAAGK